MQHRSAFFLPTSAAAAATEIICIVAEFYFRQPKQKIIKDGQAWPKSLWNGLSQKGSTDF